MAMSAAQVSAELQRKKNLGIAPTNSANMGQYNKLTSQTPMSANQAKVGPTPVSAPAHTSSLPGGTGWRGLTSPVPGMASNKPNYSAGNVKNIAAANSPVAASSAPAQPAFMYNPETDPNYQAAQRRIAADSQTATNNAMVSLGSRGIGNSSSAVTAAAQIQQRGVQQLNDTVIPQLEQAAYQRYSDDLARQDNLKNQGDQLALQEGQLTGTYLSPEMSSQYDAVIQAKQEYGSATTPEARAAARQKADAARAQIVAMGGNPDLVGSDVTLGAAQGNSGGYGVQTQAAKEFGANMDYTKGRDSVADSRYTSETDYAHTRDQRGDMVDDRNFDQSKLVDDRNFNQAKYESDRNYRQQVQQQSIANNQWQQQFNQDVEKFGFQQASELWSQAFQMNQANQDNTLKLSQADQDAASQATNNITKSGLVSIATDPDTGAQTVSVPNPDSLNNYIISLNLSDDATDSLMYQYGLGSYVKK